MKLWISDAYMWLKYLTNFSYFINLFSSSILLIDRQLSVIDAGNHIQLSLIIFIADKLLLTLATFGQGAASLQDSLNFCVLSSDSSLSLIHRLFDKGDTRPPNKSVCLLITVYYVIRIVVNN